MKKEQVKAVVEYLQNMIDFDPTIAPQDMGQCIYCGAALDEGRSHNGGCHYLRAQQLLKEFKKIKEPETLTFIQMGREELNSIIDQRADALRIKAARMNLGWRPLI